MTSKEIRASFLKYFEKNGHRIVPSSPLVPHDDPTLLFSNAGMNQFKDVLLGKETREYKRAATVQKCMRVSGKHNDLDNVGPSFRHHTFFEMLGNFSFGDYFKKEALPFAWALLTDEWKLPGERLFRDYFQGRLERASRQRRVRHLAQVPAGGSHRRAWRPRQLLDDGRYRAVRPLLGDLLLPRGRRFRAVKRPAAVRAAGLECSCDRYVEIWNNVFMEFDRQQDGTLNPLPPQRVDTGMGLERVTAVMQGVVSTYDTDAFTPLLAAIGERAGTTHGGTMSESDVSMRVVADHMRAMTFLIADGVAPSNEHRGYVLRKIMRRAMRHGKHLGMTEPFLHALVDTLVREYGDAYPELRSGREAIVQVVRSEEERFDAVLTGGLPRLEEALERAGVRQRNPRGRGRVPPLRHPWPADRLHRGHRSSAWPEVRQGGVRARDGGPAREGAREEHVQERGHSDGDDQRQRPSRS
jgi:alanyl-tRNA synthetase